MRKQWIFLFLLALIFTIAWLWSQNVGVFPTPLGQPVSSLLPEKFAESSPSPIPIPICELLSETELETVVGDKLELPTPTKLITTAAVTQETCLWTAANGGYVPTVSISIREGTLKEVLTPDDAEPTVIEELWQTELEKNQSLPSYQLIENLGEAAYQSPTGVMFRAKDQIVTVSVSLSQPSLNREVAVTIARQIAERLTDN